MTDDAHLSWIEQFFGVGPPPPNYGTPYSAAWQFQAARERREHPGGPDGEKFLGIL